MKLYAFASKNLTNIWAGVGARMWAVAETSENDMKTRTTKSRSMQIGASGILYCNETHSFTTPFLVYSPPNPDQVVTGIWPERWRLPFRILPLGNPERQMHKDTASKKLRILSNMGQGGISAAMHITGTTVFVPKEIPDEDWATLLSNLASI
ncbi:hypothetical protein [Desulfonatronum thiodismutans]|uniref:hypothetical protein n=1 Tax=Desulfonatronum thiodismutans TaxID=159290 RepID=UPI001267D6A1|nr:hypothetical protein [Desulfonatronum thiodismutans]